MLNYFFLQHVYAPFLLDFNVKNMSEKIHKKEGGGLKDYLGKGAVCASYIAVVGYLTSYILHSQGLAPPPPSEL